MSGARRRRRLRQCAFQELDQPRPAPRRPGLPGRGALGLAAAQAPGRCRPRRACPTPASRPSWPRSAGRGPRSPTTRSPRWSRSWARSLLDDDGFVIADIPGLIEGASEGGAGRPVPRPCRALRRADPPGRRHPGGRGPGMADHPRRARGLRQRPRRQARDLCASTRSTRWTAPTIAAASGAQLKRRPPGCAVHVISAVAWRGLEPILPAVLRRWRPSAGRRPRRAPASRRRRLNAAAQALRARRIVVKVGSALLVERGRQPSARGWLDGLAARRRPPARPRPAGDRRHLRRHSPGPAAARAWPTAGSGSTRSRLPPPPARSCSPAPGRRRWPGSASRRRRS